MKTFLTFVCFLTFANSVSHASHWAHTYTPFTIPMIYNLNDVWKPYLNMAITQWNRSTLLDIAYGGTAQTQCQLNSGFVTLCSADYGNNNWLGMTQTYMDTSNHITHALVMFNEYYFQQPFYDTSVVRTHVTCHELGHALGLVHRTEDGTSIGSCMDTSIDANSGNPDMIDYTNLYNEYNHIDSYNTFASSVSMHVFKAHIK